MNFISRYFIFSIASCEYILGANSNQFTLNIEGVQWIIHCYLVFQRDPEGIAFIWNEQKHKVIKIIRKWLTFFARSSILFEFVIFITRTFGLISILIANLFASFCISSVTWMDWSKRWLWWEYPRMIFNLTLIECRRAF